MGVLAYSPFEHYIVFNEMFAFVSLIGFLFIIYPLTPLKGLGLGFAWGVGYYLVGINWILETFVDMSGRDVFVSILLVISLVSTLAIFPAAIGYSINRFSKKSLFLAYFIVAPFAWFFFEYLRSTLFTGFPWLKFGYAVIDTPLKHFAPIFGVDGITYLLVLISGIIVYVLKTKDFKFLIVPVLIFLSVFILAKIQWYSKDADRIKKITLIQPNINHLESFDKKFAPIIMERLYSQIITHAKSSDMIILPETVVPGFESDIQTNEFLSKVNALAIENDITIILGVYEINFEYFETMIRKQYNTAIVFNKANQYKLPEDGEEELLVNRYRKYNLVPIGETVPFADILRPFSSVFNLPASYLSRGKYHVAPLKSDDVTLLFALCYEIIFGERLRNNFTPEVGFIVNMGNDSWFGDTIGAWQHLQMARMRALELARPVLRATNDGVTVFINANGRIVAQLPRYTKSELTLSIAPTTGITLYSQYGYLSLFIMMGVFFIIFISIFQLGKFFKTIKTS